MLPPPSTMATPIATPMATIDHTLDSRPLLMPESTDGRRAGARRLRDLADRRALGGGEVLGEVAQHLGEHEADDHRAEQLPARVRDRALVVAHVGERDDERCRDREHAGGDEARG